MEYKDNSASEEEEIGPRPSSRIPKTPLEERQLSDVVTPTESADRLTGRAALRLHLTLAAGLTLCVGAFCTETIRALDGNTLSWVYVFEWPFFAGFGIYMWWKLLHEGGGDLAPSEDGTSTPGGASAQPAHEHDEAFRAWNRYLLEMRDAESQDQGQAT
jgi:hypothetical protein